MITVRISFEKKNEASYISLLDLQRVMQRVLKRSGLPVWHTLGFNPHIYMTFACPLSLGQESECECVDVKTEAEAPDFAQWKTALNAIMPAGIVITRVAPVQMKADRIAWACYQITYPAEAAAVLDQYNALESAPVEKHGKKGNKIIELKQHIPQVAYTAEGDAVRIELCLPASQELNRTPRCSPVFWRKSSACRPPVQASCAQSSSPRTSSCLPEPGRMTFTGKPHWGFPCCDALANAAPWTKQKIFAFILGKTLAFKHVLCYPI